MCALYTLQTSYAEMLNSLKFAIDENSFIFSTEEVSSRFLPHQLAPVIRAQANRISLEPMNFSLIPSWSKERRPKFATHNARLETLKEKPTWKRPLVKNHALVPMTEFIEPIYEGDYSGHMVGFSQLENQVLWAAGLWDEWVDAKTGEIIPSFTIVTHEPSDFVRRIGHDREPLFLNSQALKPWLLNSHLEPEYWTTFLRQSHLEPTLKVRQDRKLKSSK
jgi:putative SOS response-associated peptidase YedK